MHTSDGRWANLMRHVSMWCWALVMLLAPINAVPAQAVNDLPEPNNHLRQYESFAAYNLYLRQQSLPAQPAQLSHLARYRRDLSNLALMFGEAHPTHARLFSYDGGLVPQSTSRVSDTYEVIELRLQTAQGMVAEVSVGRPLSGEPAGVILSLHQTTFCNRHEPMGGCNSRNDYSRYFLEQGYVVITPLIPGFETANEGKAGSYNNVYQDWVAAYGDTGLLAAGLYLSQLVQYLQAHEVVPSIDYTVLGLSHGAILSVFVALVDTDVEQVVSVGGGYGFDCETRAWSQPIYFGSRYDQVCESMDFGQVLQLLFPRRIDLLRVQGDKYGAVHGENVAELKALYDRYGVSERLHVNLAIPSIDGLPPHRFDLQIQEYVAALLHSKSSQE